MKKFKPILCVALMLAFGGLSLVGCGTTQTTITLDEAKTIIVNALAIEEPQAHALQIGANEAAEDEGNRNIFVKFGITSLSCKTDAYSGEALTRKLDQPCLLDKTGGTWNKYVINLTTIQNGKTTVDNEYYDGNMVYSYMNYGTPSYSKSEFEGTYSGVGKNRSQQLIIYDIMFSDKVFENCYSKEVIKTLTSSGFSLTMSMEYSKYIDLIYGELEAGMTFEDYLSHYTKEQQEVIKKSKLEFVVTFDNNENITQVDMASEIYDFVLGVEEIGYTVSSLTKSEQAVAAPEWFNSENYQ